MGIFDHQNFMCPKTGDSNPLFLMAISGATFRGLYLAMDLQLDGPILICFAARWSKKRYIGPGLNGIPTVYQCILSIPVISPTYLTKMASNYTTDLNSA